MSVILGGGNNPSNPAAPGSSGQNSDTPNQERGSDKTTTVEKAPRIKLKPPAERPAHGNVLIISRYGGWAFASRCGATLHFLDEWYRKRGLYEGICPLADTLEAAMKTKPSAIIFDNTGTKTEHMGKIADSMRTRGFPVWGTSEICDILEHNRAFGLQVALKSGMKVPRTIFFGPGRGDDWKSVELSRKQRIYRVNGGLSEAQQFVKANGGKWVFKPSDSHAGSDATFVAGSAEEMEARIASFEEQGKFDKNLNFILQEFIKGVELDTEVWVQNGEVVGLPHGLIETKKIGAGDVGQATGAQTSTLWAYKNMKAQIVKKTVGLDDFLAFLKNPIGPGGKKFLPISSLMSINTMVSEEDHDPYFLEFTPRFGYSSSFSVFKLINEDLREIFVSLARGEEPDFKYDTDSIAYCTRTQIAPAPFCDDCCPPSDKEEEKFAEKLMESATHIRIDGPLDDPDVWLWDVQSTKEGIRTAGCDGLIAEVTSIGHDLETVADPANKLADDLQVPGLYWRKIDGTALAEKNLPRLRGWGYEVPKGVPGNQEEEKEPEVPTIVAVVSK